MGSLHLFLYQKLVPLLGILWVSVSTYLLPLLNFFGTHILFRFKRRNACIEQNLDCSEAISEESGENFSNCIEQEPEAERNVVESIGTKGNGLGEKGTPELSLKFKFPTFEEFSRNIEETGHFHSFSEVPSTGNHKCEFVSGKSLWGLLEEPEVADFNVKEVTTTKNGSSFGDENLTNDGFLSDEDFKRTHIEPEAIHEELMKDARDGESGEEVTEKIEALGPMKEEAQPLNAEINDLPSDHDEFHSEKESFAGESDSVSMAHSVKSSLIDSYSDGFLSDGDFGGEFELDSSMDVLDRVWVEELNNKMAGLEENQEYDDFDEEDRDIMEELRSLEQEDVHLQNFNQSNLEFISEKDFHEDTGRGKNELIDGKDDKPVKVLADDDSKEAESKNSSSQDSEEPNKLETLWEHQDLIEQLKMELKKVRATGLPTILEESESPKMMEDLKPWKIDERFQYEDRMGELHKFYKSYRERMRKFDILNYQKMYAIGFLQLKDPLETMSRQKPSVPALASLLSQNLFPCKRKKIEIDPMVKFARELQSDLEVVYVGQMCLSWEFLQWQYEKVLDLWESDPRGIRLYNEVADEFQQFQVLVQRFLEDEPFQGPPRVQNYVKNRCVLRNLLQVPVIREDSSKDRKKARKKERGEYAITSDMLVEIMEESIRIFWRFIRADKDCTSLNIRRNQADIEDPAADPKLLLEVQTNLQKKEKKIRDLLRSGNCILRKFRRCQEDNSDQVLYFFSQVDMKLVSRVLNMSRITTDQLVWCRNKLSKISIINRKIHVEPSFLLFPC